MNIDAIKEIIKTAQNHENSTGLLASKLDKLLDGLPRVIRLPTENRKQALLQFIIAYIDSVPNFIEAVATSAQDAGIESHVYPFLEVASQYFISPEKSTDTNHQLEELVSQAYLAHRLFEEANDQYIHHAGFPLIPMETTSANLVIHYLIGESFASELDEAVSQTAEHMLNKYDVYNSDKFKEYVNIRSEIGWSEVWQQWACLMKNLEIRLDFSSETSAH